MTATQVQLFRLAQSGDTDARNRLFDIYKGLIGSVIQQKFLHYEWDECWQVGSLGLIGAIDGWPGEGTFRNYAWSSIYYGILRELNRAHPTIPTVGSLNGVSMASLNETLGDEGEEHINVIPDDSLSLEDTVIDSIMEAVDAEAMSAALPILRQLVSDLPERHREIVTLAFGLDGSDPLTQREIAEKFGLKSHSPIGYTLRSVCKKLSQSSELRAALAIASG